MSDSSLVGFELKADSDFEAGSIALNNGDTLDVAAELDAGNGTITVAADDPAAEALSGFQELKSAKPADKATLVVEGDVSKVPDPAKGESPTAPPQGPRFASSAAEKAADEAELTLEDLFPGSGSGRAVTKVDVDKAVEARDAGNDSGGDESPASSNGSSSSSSD